MLDVSAAVKAQLAGGAVRVGLLLDFDFLSGRARYFAGKGTIVAGGFTWAGIANIISFDPGDYSVDGAATNFTIGTSGVDAAMYARVAGDASEWRFRRFRAWLQLWAEDWSNLDQPFLFRSGVMTNLSYQRQGVTASIILSCESPFVARGNAPRSTLSDADQAVDFPNDRSLQWLPWIAAGYTRTWPKLPT